MAETPVPDSLNQKRQGEVIPGNHLRKSRYVGLLFFLLLYEDPEIRLQISKDHKLWMMDFIGSTSEEIVLQSFSFAKVIRDSKRVRNSLQKEINRELRAHRSPKVTRQTPPRRIGVGYRDKGALRPLHQKRNIGADALWWDDVKHLLPNSMSPPENGWITTEEVLSSGINPDSYLMYFNQVGLMASFETLSDF
jgi:hypothetical protein